MQWLGTCLRRGLAHTEQREKANSKLFLQHIAQGTLLCSCWRVLTTLGFRSVTFLCCALKEYINRLWHAPINSCSRCNIWIFQIFTWNICYYCSSSVEASQRSWMHFTDHFCLLEYVNTVVWLSYKIHAVILSTGSGWVEHLVPARAVWDPRTNYCVAAKPLCSLFNYFSEHKYHLFFFPEYV